MDLAKLDTAKGANEGFEVELYNPSTNEDLGIKINLLGKDSDEFQRVSRAQSKKRLARLTKGGFRSNATPPIEEIEQDNIELLASCTRGWRTLAKKDKEGKVVEPEKTTLTVSGNELAFSKENAVDIYTRFPWIREQVDTAIGDRANFINR